MNLIDLLELDLIRTGIRVRQRDEVVRLLGEALLDKGLVTPDFIPAVLQREDEYPTGLPTQGMAIALPHTEAQHVRRSCLAVGILEDPVLFHVMGSPDQEIPVGGVFLLAIADHDSQVLALKQLADLFQDGVTLARLAGASDAARVYEALCEGVRHLEARAAGVSRAS